jgi:hypothetical protein
VVTPKLVWNGCTSGIWISRMWIASIFIENLVLLFDTCHPERDARRICFSAAGTFNSGATHRPRKT